MKTYRLLLALFVSSAFGVEHEKPNIILIMSDDQGWGQVGYYDHPILKTPFLDSMSVNAARFDRFYAGCPVSSPTRASVLTGRSNDRTAVYDHGYGLRRQEKTIAQALKTAGYITAHFGKWHLDGLQGPGVPVLKEDPRNPGVFGFDQWLSVTNYFDIDPLMSKNGEICQFKGESSDIIVNEAIHFIESNKNKENPLFLVIWFGSPHDPWHTTEEYVGDLSYLSETEQNYYGELMMVDRSIGKLRRYLRDNGLHSNTLLWFNSDNGGVSNFGKSTVGGLRGYKGDLYEGGLRVPALVEWPGVIKPRKIDFPSVTMDIFPTIIDIVGLDDSLMVSPIDGISLKNVLLDGYSGNRNKPIPFRYLKKGALVDGNYKLIVNNIEDNDCELYDLELDPFETNDIYSNDSLSVRMFKYYKEWNSSVDNSILGGDYSAGLLEVDCGRTLWINSPMYDKYLDCLSQRKEYKRWMTKFLKQYHDK